MVLALLSAAPANAQPDSALPIADSSTLLLTDLGSDADIVPAVLISPAGWAYPSVRLPVSAPDTVPTTLDVVDDDGNATTVTLRPDLRFGSLQVVFDGVRSVLVATSTGAGDQLDALLSWLAAEPRRWSDLSGAAVMSMAGAEPVTVAAQDPARAEAYGAQPNRTGLWWAGGAAAVAAAAVGAALILRRARRRPERQ